MKCTKQHIFFVDDEPQVLQIVSETFKEFGFKVSCFDRAADCLNQLSRVKCDLLVTDVKMPEMDGIELLKKAKQVAPWLPVLVVTGYGDVPMAVAALKAGASDFIEKPLERQNLFSSIESVLKGTFLKDALLGKDITMAEMKVLRLLLDGKKNREIADLLKRSIRTVEVHRRHIMCKLGVHTLVDLVRRATLMELVKLPENK